ncbi:ABC transporter ATP-binding protein [Aureliella helgolandensis]|uniref:Bicarbonate transport ATP-binding protein CmpD n=1 Tax=Aureliella helgolandensis TaxID=2527968 RepID=A0A518GGR6_9BACT|nr:nitrate ABC transporter ATP-binding protein [Aureliella helgolandensis]QDV27791.1 Bicarbonate transport ATP-binding protein CmpD [Aureliella helgolandensis]
MAGFVEMFKLGKTYDTPHGPAVIVEDFSLNMQQGEYVCLLGHSGCGKSTVLTMVAGLNSISHGGVIIDNREIDGPGPDRGIVFQSPCLMPWMTAFENVMLGVKQVYPHGTRQQRHDIVAYYLNLVGLGDSLHKNAGELSQGMQQRVGIARAFALKPRMLLLDEPFGMLDSLTRMELQEILQEILTRDRITTLMITHDVDEALFMSDRVVMMTNGPRARVGAVFEMPFERPRERADVLAHPEYYALREKMISFLEEQDHKKQQKSIEELAAKRAAAAQTTVAS